MAALDSRTVIVAARGDPTTGGALSVVSLAPELWERPDAGRARVKPEVVFALRDCELGYIDIDTTRLYGDLCGPRAVEVDRELGYAYVASELTATIAVVSLADPARPQLRGRVRDPALERVFALARIDETLYAATPRCSKRCVVRVNTANKRTPAIVGTIEVADSPLRYSLAGLEALARPLPRTTLWEVRLGATL